jgi:transposase-like protein
MTSREGEEDDPLQGRLLREGHHPDVRWYVAYPLSYRQLEELMRERGISVDHTTINRRMVMYRSPLAATVQRQAGRPSSPQKMTSGVDRVVARSTTSRKERMPCNTC